MRANRLLIRGMVQGVGFRYYAERTATELQIRGFVRNLADGRVEAVAAGPPERLAIFIARLREGPPGGRVETVSRRPTPSWTPRFTVSK